MKQGDKAPAFAAPDQTGAVRKLSDYKGKFVVVYFYPKDDTPGCTLEGKDFAAHEAAFAKRGAVVFGVSKDSVKSHAKFHEKYCFNFPLLSAEESTLCEDYGVWVEKSMYGKKYMGTERTTFLIDPKGTIAHVWNKVKVDGHVADVLQTIDNLKAA